MSDLLTRLLVEKEELTKKLEENASNIAELSGDDVGHAMVEPAPLAVSKITDTPWLVDGLFHSVGFGVLGSPPFTGKTYAAAHIAGSISAGLPIFGPFRANRAVPVLYVYYESSRDEFLLTLKRTLESRQISGDNVFVNAGNVPIARLRIGTPGLEATIRATGAKFCVIDTLAFAHGGDESNEDLQSKLITPLVDMVKRLGVFLLLVHHSSKAADNVDEVYGFRGGSVLPAAADVLLKVERIKGEPRDSKKRRLVIAKVRGAPAGSLDIIYDFGRRVIWADGQDPREIIWPPERYAAAKQLDPFED